MLMACQAKCQRMTAELASMEREAQLRTLEAQRDRDQRQVTQQTNGMEVSANEWNGRLEAKRPLEALACMGEQASARV